MVFGFKANSAIEFNWNTALTTLPLDPVTVSGVFDINPSVIFGLGIDYSISKPVEFNAGARMAWTGAKADVDLTTLEVSNIDGWQPDLEVTTPSFNRGAVVNVYPYMRRLYQIVFTILGSKIQSTATFTSQTGLSYKASVDEDNAVGSCKAGQMRLQSYANNEQNIVFANGQSQLLNSFSQTQNEVCFDVPSSRPTLEEIAALRVNGQDFCTSYNAYLPPVVGVYTTGTVYGTTTTTTTVTSVVLTTPTVISTTITNILATRAITTTATVTRSRQGDATLAAQYQKRDDVSIPMITAPPVPAQVERSTSKNHHKRSIAPPTIISGWDTTKIRYACSQVATGKQTNTYTTEYSTSYTSTAVLTDTYQSIAGGTPTTQMTTFTSYAWSTSTAYAATRSIDSSCPLQSQASCFKIKGHGLPQIEGKELGLKDEVAQANFNVPATTFYLACDGSLVSLPDTRALVSTTGLFDFVPFGSTTSKTRIKCAKNAVTNRLTCTTSAGSDIAYMWSPSTPYFRTNFYQITPLEDPRYWNPTFVAGSADYLPVTFSYQKVDCPCTNSLAATLPIYSATSPSCPAADGTTFTTSDGWQWQIQCNIDYNTANGVQSSAYASTLLGCIKQCDADSSCLLATQTQQGYCNLKYEVTDAPVSSDSRHSIVRLAKSALPRQLLKNAEFSCRGSSTDGDNDLVLSDWNASPGAVNCGNTILALEAWGLNGYNVETASMSQTVGGLVIGKWYRLSVEKLYYCTGNNPCRHTFWVDGTALKDVTVASQTSQVDFAVDGPYAFQATATSHTVKFQHYAPVSTCDHCGTTNGIIRFQNAKLVGPYDTRT